MSDVFISYAREDQQQAEWLATLLVERGWSVFWDRTIPPGKTWDEVIGSELDTARAVIVLWSESAVASEWVREEAHEAKGRGVLVPAQLDSARPPFGFRQIQAANLADWKGDAADPRLGELVGALSAILGDASATTAGYAAGESSAPDPGETAPDAAEPLADAPAVARDVAVPAASPVQVGPAVEADLESGLPGSSAATSDAPTTRGDGPDAERGDSARPAGGVKSGPPQPAPATASVDAGTLAAPAARPRPGRRMVAGVLAGLLVVGTGAYWWRTAGNAASVASTVAGQDATAPAGSQSSVPPTTDRETVAAAAESQASAVTTIEPEMVTVRAGSFRMGSEASEGGRGDERPVRTVTIARPFRIGKYEVTFDDYERFASATGRSTPDHEGWGRGMRPVINVSWRDAVAYAAWLSKQTGKRYRLPTEAEWEYVARAGTRTQYWWGDEVQSQGKPMANCDGCGSQWDNKQTAPVGQFAANAFGVHDVHGNVWEWVQDCWHDSYQGAPEGGGAWLEADGGQCGLRVLRGGSWRYKPEFMRAANRIRLKADSTSSNVGFRLAQDL